MDSALLRGQTEHALRKPERQSPIAKQRPFPEHESGVAGQGSLMFRFAKQYTAKGGLDNPTSIKSTCLPGQRRLPMRQNSFNQGHLIQLSSAVKPSLQTPWHEFAKLPDFLVARTTGTSFSAPTTPES